PAVPARITNGSTPMSLPRAFTLSCSLLLAVCFLHSVPDEGRTQPQTVAALAAAAQPGQTKTTSSSMERITAGSAYPLSAIVHIETKFASGRVYYGSGTLVGRYHVLTAGHVVYNAREGGTGFATEIKVFAGEVGSVNPFGFVKAKYMRTFQSFIDDDKASK